MKRYQRKPQPFSAIQWDGTNEEAIHNMLEGTGGWLEPWPNQPSQPKRLVVVVSWGELHIKMHDYIIRTDDGRVDSCNAEYFMEHNEEIADV